MVNHKWKDESFSRYYKEERCIKCGVFRTWLGGDMQCWEYWWPKKYDLAMIKKQFNRSTCRIKTTKKK